DPDRVPRQERVGRALHVARLGVDPAEAAVGLVDEAHLHGREVYRSSVVGLSLLTLVPGVVGGSETYARELCRALARVGELEYRAFVPAIAADAADGLPSELVPQYRGAQTMPGRIAAMSLATVRPGPLRRALELDRLDAVHFPLSVMLPS